MPRSTASSPRHAQPAVAVPTQSGLPAAAWAIGGMMTAVILALSATLVWTQTHQSSAAVAAAPLAAPAALATPTAAIVPAGAVVVVAAAPEATRIAPTPAVRHVAAPSPRPAAVARAPAPSPSPAPTGGWERSTQGSPVGWEQPAPRPAQVVSCPSCGTVESVRNIEQRGEATGLGAVIGGVVGGAVGSQIGGGNGKKVATVVGAIGGGIAGHEIEKRQRSHTVYEVRVRMDDGSTRVITQSQPISVGTPVQVSGDSLSVRSSRSSDRYGSDDDASYRAGYGGRTWRTGG